jgi:hypothetical protein
VRLRESHLGMHKKGENGNGVAETRVLEIRRDQKGI